MPHQSKHVPAWDAVPEVARVYYRGNIGEAVANMTLAIQDGELDVFTDRGTWGATIFHYVPPYIWRDGRTFRWDEGARLFLVREQLRKVYPLMWGPDTLDDVLNRQSTTESASSPAPQIDQPQKHSGRKPLPESGHTKLAQRLFDQEKPAFTFAHGELAKVARRIASADGVKLTENYIQRLIRPDYKELKRRHQKGES